MTSRHDKGARRQSSFDTLISTLGDIHSRLSSREGKGRRIFVCVFELQFEAFKDGVISADGLISADGVLLMQLCAALQIDRGSCGGLMLMLSSHTSSAWLSLLPWSCRDSAKTLWFPLLPLLSSPSSPLLAAPLCSLLFSSLLFSSPFFFSLHASTPVFSARAKFLPSGPLSVPISAGTRLPSSYC